MRLGVLETGRLSPELEAEYGPYAPMFERLLQPASPALRIDVFAVVDGETPPSVDACDAWLITGSKHGVYDDLPWIEPLKAFLRKAYAAERPLIGVCFGHQIMAEALGGRAEKSAKGWGLGRSSYQIDVDDPAWFGALAPAEAETLQLHAIHQDQVVAAPPGSRVIAHSPFCEIAALAYGPAAAPRAISIQPHPEFDAALLRALIDMRAGDVIPMESATAGREGSARRSTLRRLRIG